MSVVNFQGRNIVSDLENIRSRMKLKNLKHLKDSMNLLESHIHAWHIIYNARKLEEHHVHIKRIIHFLAIQESRNTPTNSLCIIFYHLLFHIWRNFIRHIISWSFKHHLRTPLKFLIAQFLNIFKITLRQFSHRHSICNSSIRRSTCS